MNDCWQNSFFLCRCALKCANSERWNLNGLLRIISRETHHHCCYLCAAARELQGLDNTKTTLYILCPYNCTHKAYRQLAVAFRKKIIIHAEKGTSGCTVACVLQNHNRHYYINGHRHEYSLSSDTFWLQVQHLCDFSKCVVTILAHYWLIRTASSVWL